MSESPAQGPRASFLVWLFDAEITWFPGVSFDFAIALWALVGPIAFVGCHGCCVLVSGSDRLPGNNTIMIIVVLDIVITFTRYRWYQVPWYRYHSIWHCDTLCFAHLPVYKELTSYHVFTLQCTRTRYATFIRSTYRIHKWWYRYILKDSPSLLALLFDKECRVTQQQIVLASYLLAAFIMDAWLMLESKPFVCRVMSDQRTRMTFIVHLGCRKNWYPKKTRLPIGNLSNGGQSSCFLWHHNRWISQGKDRNGTSSWCSSENGRQVVVSSLPTS